MAGPLSDDDLAALHGKIVTRTFKAGYVVLSYLVSYIGAFTTLEIIMKRTGSRGWYNWFLLAAVALSMGGIAIWCMHFVGNCAIVLGSGQAQIQIVISPGFTALSFFIPILVVFIAFGVVGSDESSITRVILGGILAGLGVCGMHFLGQAGIANYDCIYDVANFVSAAVIAVVASVVALVFFFISRSAWQASWWKRALVGVILASAVSGMHWVASVGTNYRYKETGTQLANTTPISTTVVIIIVMSILCCAILVFLSLVEQARYRKMAKRAEQVVLATAIFDSNGRLLVTQEGLLPTKKIANSWMERSFEDIFNVAHPVFLWIFRASRNWYGISTLVPGMRKHIRRSGIKRRHGSLDETVLFNDEGIQINDFSIVFRELFCIAAAELASDLHQPIDKLGVLYDEILVTGLGATAAEKGKKSIATAASSLLDVEREADTLGKGQLLFLVSRASRYEVENLLSAGGFTFANTESVLPVIANSLRIGPRGLSRRLEIMRHYCTDHHVLEPGFHVAFFAIRASLAVGKRGFDVLVRRDAKNQLPTMQAPIEKLEPWHVEYLKSMDSQTISVIVKQLFKASKPSNKSQSQRDFAKHLLKTIEVLKEEIEDTIFNDAMLIATPFEVPCRGHDEYSPPGVALLIAFRMILPLQGRAPGRKLTFTPLALFKAQQRVYRNSPDHKYFARSVHREFAPLMDNRRSFSGEDVSESTSFPLTFRNSISSRLSRNDIAMGAHIDMYGNAVPESSRDNYRGPPKVGFWDKPALSFTRRKTDRASEQELMNLRAPDNIDINQITDDEYGQTEERRKSSRPCSVASPGRLGSPGIGTEMRRLSAPNKPHSPPGKPAEESEESRLYIDELFKITIEKRQM
ncbi:hypothetical protein BUE80_DR007606 [Diplocarpon rosae]|nr:hypothetical protein BUE80_DR007606 [Diplocarpon rosae]